MIRLCSRRSENEIACAVEREVVSVVDVDVGCGKVGFPQLCAMRLYTEPQVLARRYPKRESDAALYSTNQIQEHASTTATQQLLRLLM